MTDHLRWERAALRSRESEIVRGVGECRGLKRLLMRFLLWFAGDRRDGDPGWTRWPDGLVVRLCFNVWACSVCGREFLLAKSNVPPKGLRSFAKPICPACKPDVAFGGGA